MMVIMRAAAESIKKFGQIHPILLSADGETLIDGRNRLRACEIAGVEPKFERLKEGDDPVAVIISLNLSCRYRGPGEVAIAEAMEYPDEATGPEYPFCGSQERLRRARVVVQAGSFAVDSVLKGRSLDDLYEEVERIRLERQHNAEKWNRLPPDLKESVKKDVGG